MISRIINKSRDCIDPTFIFNIEPENKKMITNKMNKNKLNIILKYRTKEIKYAYKYGKKRRFYLQYTNSRNINKLFNYLTNELSIHNNEWIHCFEIIKGKSLFDKLYDNLYFNELKLINTEYIYEKINDLKNKLKISELTVLENSISQYKNNFQSKVFEYIYEYVSLIRWILIKENISTKYLNLLNMYDILEKSKVIDKNIFIEIYKYMWNLEKLTVYCYENNINYGLHNHDLIDYSKEELNENFVILKNLILCDLERLGGFYEQSNINITNDARRW